MLPCSAVYRALQDAGVRCFAGVPDSLLKDFCAYVSDHAPQSRHTITANEGAAVALVCGHHLATGELGLVYLQNSGQGNTVNPLTSLASLVAEGVPGHGPTPAQTTEMSGASTDFMPTTW